MNTKILIVAAFALALLVGMAGVNAESGKGINVSAGDSVDITGLQVAANADAEAELEENKTENKSRDEKREEIKERVREEIEEKREAAKERVENKTGEKVNLGRLVKEVQQVRKQQFKLTKEILRSVNYTGSMDEFATAYNEAIKGLKAEIKAKVESGNTSDLNMRIVKSLAEERLIKARIETFAKLGISVDNVTAELAKYVNEKQKLEVLRADIRGIRPKFALRVYAIMKEGTPEEQAALKAQLEAYAANINGTVKKVAVKEVDVSKIRKRLNKNERVLLPSETKASTAAE